jgi:hypothetical protein
MIRAIKARLRPFLPGNLPETIRQIKERGFNHCHVLSFRPAVIYLCWGRDDTALHEGLKNRKLILLYMFPGRTRAREVPGIARKIRKTLKHYTGHRIVLLCNELFTVDLFLAEDVEAIFCNQNCFVNEKVFTTNPSAVKLFDAVYNACMASYKRHALAQKVESLALMTYRYGGTYQSDYESSVRASLSHAKWVKDSYSDNDKVPVEEIVRFYHQCRVGLCLSEIEGAMFASIEYLLSGLPIVTTRSVGGRDVFYDPEYVLIVDDNAEAVSEGVKEMCARAPDPDVIRTKTLARMAEHRRWLRDFLRDEISEIELPWAPGSHGPMTFMSLKSVAQKCRDAAKT